MKSFFNISLLMGGLLPFYAAIAETKLDLPWATVAHEMVESAKAGQPLRPILVEKLPDLERQLKDDSARNSWKELWGQSLNFDEHAKAAIVDPAIINMLSAEFGVKPLEGQVMHAGLGHTYGYLFSVLSTPYGFKRARWVEGEIAEGFGLPADTFSPAPHGGTLFSNLTYFVGRIAFRDLSDSVATLLHGSSRLPEALRKFDFDSIRVTTLVESAGSFEMRTDLVKFLFPSGGTNTTLLIYSVSNPLYGRRLITAFPVQSGFAAQLTDEEDLGRGKKVTTHYNAYLEGVTGKEVDGDRNLIETRKKVRKKNGKHS